MAPKSKDDIASSIAKLSLKTAELDKTAAATSQPRRPGPQKKSSPVADSWEDEADDDSDAVASDAEATPVASTSTAGIAAPPPTPLAGLRQHPPFDGSGAAPPPPAGRQSAAEGPTRRPEKTDAVAQRMIASALGMRAPKRTEEQKAYDRAVREKERKKREEEKEKERKREEEIAKARQAIWDD
ncbi:600d113f-10b5-4d60-9617-c91adf233f4d [Thermothielavioides terrestris]|uniref:600d113f-10b5-4d60-9617-c91adf233f4d n=1 Tax=Thermothielavioides terrestris TaxID=2587410 RepID=A0A3S4AQR1_9PEZI|nr:600d113f-10b5-4d60-9617-c91adf233f4d [Thermothielavioides terrestris]